MNRWRFAIWASNMYYRISQHCIASKPLIFYLIIFLNSSVLSQWRNYLGTALLMTDFSTDYGRLIKPFPTTSQTFGQIGQIDWINFGVFGVFSAFWALYLSPFYIISLILMFFLQKKLCFSSITQIYPKYDIGHKEFEE